MKTRLRYLSVGSLGIVASAVFLWAAARHLDLASVAQAWRAARPLPWIPLAALCYLLGQLVRGQRLRFLVRREASLELGTATNIVVVGYGSNNVLPARLGEFVRAGMLAERTGMPITQALTVTFVERLLDGVSILILLVLSTWMVRPAAWVLDLAHVAIAVFSVAILGLSFAVLLPRALVSMVSRGSQRFGVKWHGRALDATTSIVNGVVCLRHPGEALVIGLLSILVWLCDGAMFALVLPALGMAPSLGLGVVAMSVTNLGILLPSTPGFVGPFHFFCASVLGSQGIPPAIAFSFAVLVHLTFYVPITLWGAGAMLWYGIEVGAAAAMARAARRSPSHKVISGVPLRVIARAPAAASPPKPGAFDVALTEALVPEGTAPQPMLVLDVASFLADEVDALPYRLKVLYGLGMRVFRFWVVVRYGGSFCGLSSDRRKQAVSAWAYGRVAQLRQLFRMPRSTVLLAFYEHPLLVEQAAHLSPEAVREFSAIGDVHG